MNPILMNAILSMDSYNRGYGQAINVTGSQVGNAQILKTTVNGVVVDLDSGIIRDPVTNSRLDDDISFYAIAYDYNGGTVISYRGTDDLSLDAQYGWAANSALNTQPQAQMAFQFYNSVAGGIDPRTANITLTGHSLSGGLAGLVGANDNAQQARNAA